MIQGAGMKKRKQNMATALFAAGILSIAGIALHSLNLWMLIAIINVVITVVVGFFLLSEEVQRDS